MSRFKKFIVIAKLISGKLSKDNLTAFAAQSCFYMLLSFIPFLVLLIGLIQFLPITANTLIDIMSGILPDKIMPILSSIIFDLYNNSSLAIISMTTIISLWSAAKGFTSIVSGLNTIYGTYKRKGWLISRIISIFYTIIFLFSIILSLILMVFGASIAEVSREFVPGLARILMSIFDNRLLLFPGILMIVFMLVYTFVPTRKNKLLRQIPGALFASMGWFLFSSAYSVYTSTSTGFATMYGSLATLVFTLVWLYVCMLIIFLGAELNSIIQIYVYKDI